MPDDRHPREKRQLACCRCRSRKLAKCCTGECDRRRDPAGGGIVATQTLPDKSEILACLKGLSVVALVFLLVGLLFPAALPVGFSPGRIRWLRWSVLVHGSRRAQRMLFLALCGRRLLRRLVLLHHGWARVLDGFLFVFLPIRGVLSAVRLRRRIFGAINVLLGRHARRLLASSIL